MFYEYYWPFDVKLDCSPDGKEKGQLAVLYALNQHEFLKDTDHWVPFFCFFRTVILLYLSAVPISLIDSKTYLVVPKSYKDAGDEEKEIYHHLRMISRFINALLELRIEMEF